MLCLILLYMFRALENFDDQVTCHIASIHFLSVWSDTCMKNLTNNSQTKNKDTNQYSCVSLYFQILC